MLPRDKKLRPYSTILRNNATSQENHLWYDFLRNYHFQFNRQMIIGEYIIDFYCRKAKLAIEVDGSGHFTEDAKEYDNIRTKYLENMGIKVIRFTNSEIDNKFEDVCNLIDFEVQNRVNVNKSPVD